MEEAEDSQSSSVIISSSLFCQSVFKISLQKLFFFKPPNNLYNPAALEKLIILKVNSYISASTKKPSSIVIETNPTSDINSDIIYVTSVIFSFSFSSYMNCLLWKREIRDGSQIENVRWLFNKIRFPSMDFAFFQGHYGRWQQTKWPQTLKTLKNYWNIETSRCQTEH